jgi:AraC-like DNA-binding protein
MASPPDYRGKGSHRSRGHPPRRKKIKGVARKNLPPRAEAMLHGQAQDPAQSEASSHEAIRAHKYRRLARKHWRTLARTPLIKFGNFRLCVAWMPNATTPAQTPAHRIPIIVDDTVIGCGFLLKTNTRRKKSSRPEVTGAVTLLRFFVRYVALATSLQLRNIDLVKARQRAAEHEHEEIKLRTELSRRMTGISEGPARAEKESHTEQLVHRMLDYIEKEYARPITLKECANHLEFNAAYLCNLFSRTVGISFKRYLTRLRVEKARALLSDPTRRVSDVAYTVGYTDVGRFRLAFKAATGLAPATWRNSLKT